MMIKKFETRLEKFTRTHNNSLKNIEEILLDSEHPELQALANLLTYSEINPYSYLPEEWANIDSAQSLESLLKYISHALYDDGDICFPIVHGEPCIRFLSQYDNVSDILKNELREFYNLKFPYSENTTNKIIIDFIENINSSLEFCKDTFDFVTKLNAYHTYKLTKYVRLAYSTYGKEFVMKHYPEYADFDLEYLENNNEH